MKSFRRITFLSILVFSCCFINGCATAKTSPADSGPDQVIVPESETIKWWQYPLIPAYGLWWLLIEANRFSH